MYNRFSNLYINYYYGSKILLNEKWGEKDAVCSYSKIYYILRGECEIVIEKNFYRAKSGDFFIIPAGVKHSFYHINDNYIQKYWFHFDIEAEGESLFDIINVPYCCNIGINRRIISLFRSIFVCASGFSPSEQLMLNSKILELLSEYCSITKTDFSLTRPNESQLIGIITEYINEHINRDIVLDELADIAHFHPNYFIRFFKEHMGVTPSKYVNNIKLERAKSLLENTNIPVKEIMSEVGFSDYSHFSKFFKAHSGYSPSAFRSYYSKI